MDLRTASDPVADPALRTLVEDAVPRRTEALGERERVTELLAAVGFTAAACGVALLLPQERSLDLPLALALTAVLAFASRIRFYVGAGYAVPTQLAFVPMLFLLPLPIIPAAVAIAFAAGKGLEAMRGNVHGERVLSTSVADAWHSLGPVIVLGAAGATTPDWGDWPIYVAALAAQLLFDLVSSVLRERFALGVAAPIQVRVMAGVYLVDVLLAPVGLAVAFTAADEPYAAVLVAPLYLLLTVFARERDSHITSVVELSSTYRGTALLLGDVLEGADEATGVHSRSVVTLALKVADRMGLDPAQQRNVEFAALLHDIGKISIPPEILHKRGPLDRSEWRVMRTHTIEGHRMLRIVGGNLEDVGRIVRATHERWDGEGYPDGLKGPEIPIEACVVACCDAFDAMTSDRPYRAAMPVQAAMGELRSCAGSQFHPGVAKALIGVLEDLYISGEATDVQLPSLVEKGVAPSSQPA